MHENLVVKKSKVINNSYYYYYYIAISHPAKGHIVVLPQKTGSRSRA